eukprot:76281-Hanusia_phi.AAC.1
MAVSAHVSAMVCPSDGIPIKVKSNQDFLDPKKLREQLESVGSMSEMDFLRIPSDFGNTGGEASPLHLVSLRDEIQS